MIKALALQTKPQAYYGNRAPKTNVRFGGHIQYTQPGDFAHTARYKLLTDKGFYPDEFVNPEALRGKTILDVGAGRPSEHVYDLRRGEYDELGFVPSLLAQGIDAYALDFADDPEVLEQWSAYPGHFFKADARAMPFDDNTFDLTYNTVSIMSLLCNDGVSYREGGYYKDDDGESIKRLCSQALREMIRVTKPGGKIRMSYVNRPAVKNLLDETQLGNLVTVRYGEVPLDSEKHYWVELTKKPTGDEPGTRLMTSA